MMHRVFDSSLTSPGKELEAILLTQTYDFVVHGSSECDLPVTTADPLRLPWSSMAAPAYVAMGRRNVGLPFFRGRLDPAWIGRGPGGRRRREGWQGNAAAIADAERRIAERPAN